MVHIAFAKMPKFSPQWTEIRLAAGLRPDTMWEVTTLSSPPSWMGLGKQY